MKILALFHVKGCFYDKISLKKESAFYEYY